MFDLHDRLREIREERVESRGKPMDKFEYDAAVSRIGLLARMALELDIDRLLLMIDRAETLGPILDPTLYRDFLNNRKAQADIEALKGMAKHVAGLQREVEKLLDAWTRLL